MELKLAISNIAWDAQYDEEMNRFLVNKGITGLEIAPTRWFPEHPYDQTDAAKAEAERIKTQYGLPICSMQSIWYGRTEKIFGTAEEREYLVEYTKKAILFAESIGAGNLVFGCPKNRCSDREEDYEIAIDFFTQLGLFAEAHHTVVSMEANPVIYGTNFINKTKEAIELIKEVDSKGFKLNLDFGTIIYNDESIKDLEYYVGLINHVHISEPSLNLIEHRKEHKELMQMLRACGYDRYVSIEMGKRGDIEDVHKTVDYLMTL